MLNTSVYKLDNSIESNPEGDTAVDVSIVSAGLNEAKNVCLFLDEVREALLDIEHCNIEVLFIDDGSTDETSEVIQQYMNAHPSFNLTLVTHAFNKGITGALNTGFCYAKGRWVGFLPCDMESSPKEDLPKLLAEMIDGVDLVAGYRLGRKDGKELASRIYNWLNKKLFRLELKDANWIKFFRRELSEGIQFRSQWHRFLLPMICYNRQVSIKEVPLNWYPRRHGQSNFGLKRFPISLANMLAVKANLEFGENPLLLTGWVAIFFLILSVFFALLWSLTPLSNMRLIQLEMAGVIVFSVSAIFSVLVGITSEMLLGYKSELKK